MIPLRHPIPVYAPDHRAARVVEQWQAQFESDQIVRAILAAGRSE